MKNNKILLILFLILAGAGTYFLATNKSGTTKEELKDFSVKDTADISKIFIADRNGLSVTLTRTSDRKWKLNDKYNPRRANILNLLEVLYKIEVKNKVAKAAYNNVIKSLASNGVKCEIYLNGSETPSKVIYVGNQTEDGLGTFMMIENSNTPFITYIPGFNGYLTPRFSPVETNWRDVALFTYQPEDISSVKVEYGNFPENSFLIEQSNGQKKLSSPDGSNPSEPDTTGINNYLNLYSSVYFESIVTDMNKNSVDSMISVPPSIRLSINVKKESHELYIYPMPINESSLSLNDSLGKPLKYDVDRVYGYLQPEKMVILIQQQTINKLFRRRIDFMLHKNSQAVQSGR